ncbi:MAG: hypothetical protein Q8L44_03965, partial [Sulfuritalea sp.]|nr:hypothetical protein [Sulfuritalea sp.]
MDYFAVSPAPTFAAVPLTRMPGLAPAGEILSCDATRKYPKKRALYGSQSLVTDRFKDMGNSYYPAWMSSGGDSHALEGCATNG